MYTRTPWRFSAVAILTVVGLWAVSVSVGESASEAAPQRKNYSSTAFPTSVKRGVFTKITIEVKNLTTSNTSFSAVRLSVPSVFEMGATTVSRGILSPGTGHRIEILNANVGPGTSLVVTQFVRADCSAPTGAPLWTTDVRQSNDYNGSLNKFVLNGSDASVAISSPCHGALVTCTAGDNEPCQTGDFTSPSGNVASIVVNDTDTVGGDLSAQFSATPVQCDEYATTSDRLRFSMTVTNGVNVSALTKTVKVTQVVQPSKGLLLSKYLACFQAPYDFEAQLPSELAEDFNDWDFTGNTQLVEIPASGSTPASTEYKGLLLPCETGRGVPCVEKKYLNEAQTTITMELTVTVADPMVSF